MNKTVAWIALAVFTLAAPLSEAHGLTGSLVTTGSAAPGPATALGRDVYDAPAGYVPHTFTPQLPTWTGGAPANQIRYRCPDIAQSVYTVPGCPAFIIDPEDIMTQPVLMVDPFSTNLVAFHALHGGRGLQTLPNDAPPTLRSRDDSIHQPHTVFQSKDAGRTWDDMRYYSPWHCVNQNPTLPCTNDAKVFGEENTATLDAQGRIVIASLYIVEDQRLGDGLHYRIATWKGSRINKDMDYDVNRAIIDTSRPNNVVEGLGLAYAPTTDVVVLAWREQGQGPDPSTGLDSWIEFRYTQPGGSSRWVPLPPSARFGPCSTTSNLVAIKDMVYVVCKRELARTASSNATSLGYHLVGLNTRNWTVADLGPVSITRGLRPVLADTRQSSLVVAAAGVDPAGKPFAEVGYGRPGAPWEGPFQFGPNLMNASATLQRSEARVTAIAYREDIGHLYVLYMERFNVDPTDAGSSAREYYKTIGNIAVNGANLEYLGKSNLNIGDAATRINFSPTYQGIGQGVFDDLQDSFAVWHDAKGNPKVFVAFGDFGYVRLAELYEDNPAVMFGFPFPPAVPPIPLAAAGVNPALVGALAGTLSAAMVLRMLAAKKKATVEAPSL